MNDTTLCTHEAGMVPDDEAGWWVCELGCGHHTAPGTNVPSKGTTRTRGIAVYPMPEAVSNDGVQYALLVRDDGQVKMIHTEGVAYTVTDDKPWVHDENNPYSHNFTPHELILNAFYVQPVDLADWVRGHGAARLESNFHQIVRWNNEVTV